MLYTKGFRLKMYIIAHLLILATGDICSPNPCQNAGKCTPFGDNQFKCQCMHGWKGYKCEENIDDCNRNSNPCKNGGECVDQKNSRYTCRCFPNYIGDQCQFVNQCFLNNPCFNGAQCVALADGDFHCKCQNKYIGKLCKDKAVKCPDNINDTRESCSYHGECQVNENQELSCKCDIGYTGKVCNQKLNDGIEMGCRTDYCVNGKCIKKEDGSPKCICSEGFGGEKCSIKLKETKNEALTEPNSNRYLNENGITMKHARPVLGCDSECRRLSGDGICNKQCNSAICDFDGGDCYPWKKCLSRDHCRQVFNDGKCDPECNSVDCLFDGADCQRSTCPYHLNCSKLYQNNICNEECNNPQCGFDGGDCQTKSGNTFFSSDGLLSQCSSETKIFELDLIVMTSKKRFASKKFEFLQKLSSSLRIVVTIVNLTAIKFNSKEALLIKFYVNHTQCILHGGQCFSSLDQISNFIEAGIENGNALSLPFRVAKVDTRIISKRILTTTLKSYVLILGLIGIGLILTLASVGVLLRDKWGKLRTKIKTAGVWTPSDGYSTSTSSINSGHKPGWPNVPQMKDFKKEYHIQNQHYNENNFKFDQQKRLQDDNNNDKININGTRKRKYQITNRNDKASTFQLISDSLEGTDGIYPIDSSFTDIYDIMNRKSCLKFEDKFQNSSLEGLGEYVNENGESLMHIAARMNCGPNLIKQLNAISPSMLQSLDEWGRTPLSTSIAADAVESAEQLVLLEKQLRKESKQNKSRSGVGGINSGVSYEYLVKKTTALIESVKLNSKEMINLLLDEGNPVNVLDTYGRSIVHWAATYNNVALLERLSHMKIFQKLADLKDNEDKSPLYLAANEGHVESVKFLLEYFNKNGIKIDPNCPCPRMIADEKGFHEIRDLIYESLKKVTIVEKNGKRIKLKESKIRNKIPNFETPTSNLCIIDEYKELSANSIEQFQYSPVGNESIDSCLQELYSITDPSMHNTQDLNLCSSFKPVEYKYQGYQSNTSSSDMSPPLLNLNNPQFQNGFNPMTYTDSMDPNFSNTIFMSPQTFISQPDIINKNQVSDQSTEFYNFQSSPTIYDYEHHSITLSTNCPPLNCPL